MLHNNIKNIMLKIIMMIVVILMIPIKNIYIYDYAVCHNNEENNHNIETNHN